MPVNLSESEMDDLTTGVGGQDTPQCILFAVDVTKVAQNSWEIDADSTHRIRVC